MGNRLTKIYTRNGDNGTTGLGDGSRVPKNHLRVECLGEIDELNSVIGLILTEKLPDEIHSDLTQIQHILFNVGGEIAVPGFSLITKEQTSDLETMLDRCNEDLPALKEFILPGGSKASTYCHLARSVCRRAERRIYELNQFLSEQESEEPLVNISHYINRLSDYLFVVARYINKSNNINDVLWKNPTSKVDNAS